MAALVDPEPTEILSVLRRKSLDEFPLQQQYCLQPSKPSPSPRHWWSWKGGELPCTHLRATAVLHIISLQAVDTMVGRASVTRELGSPAALLDLTSRSRRSSSRASQRTAPAHELTTSNPTQSSVSLPPTPLTSSFDEILPSAKRRRTQRAINSEDKTFPSGGTETPTHRAFSEPFQAPKSHNSARTTRGSNLAQFNTQSPHLQNASLTETDPGTPSRSKSKTPASDKSRSEQTVTPKLQTRQQTTTVKTEPDKDAPRDSPMGAAMSHSRITRKPQPARLNGSADQENATTPSKGSMSRAASPQSSRRDRKSRHAASTAASITKPSPGAKTQSTPSSAAKAKPLVNGTGSAAAPAEQPEAATPSTSTRPRRDRKSTRAHDLDPGSKQETANSTSKETGDKDVERSQSQSPNKRSNTVTLNVGRKPLESLLAQQTPNGDTSNIETPANVGNGDYHFEYDTDMYRNNYGLDGHMDAPTSPTSMSTTTSSAARTSGRTRKPTIRALESFESERRHRRPRALSVRATAEPTEAAPPTNTTQKTTHGLSPSKTALAHKPDIMSIAKLIYKLTAEALAPDFVPAPEADTWISELQQKVDQRVKEKEHEQEQDMERQKENEDYKEKENEQEMVAMSAEEEVAGGGRESTPPSSKPYSDNVQVSTPWTDEDGWEYTGQVNKYEEEYVIIPPKFEWYRPNNTYGDDRLPLPPVRLRSLVQAEKDRALGYPPRIGDRNIPINQEYFLYENVPEEKAKLKIKEAARERGIFVSRFMTPEEIQIMIDNYDSGKPPVPLDPPVPPIVEEPLKVKESTRKRRRNETAPTPIKPSEVDTPRPKRRRQDADNITPFSAPEPSADGREKPSLKVKLVFENKQLLREHVAATQAKAAGQSKKRPHSEAEDNATDTQPPKAQKGSTSTPAPPPSTPAKGAENSNTAQVTPGSAEQTPPETTPGGRPRRRAADALMANFQRHAEARALRSERAKMGHAKRKGTPLKTVTGVHGDAVESPIRPGGNPMKTDPVQH